MPREDAYARAPRLPDGAPLDPASLFEAAGGPIELDVGPGRGGFLFERLAADPAVRLLGLEVRRKWATLVDDRLRARGLGGRARCFAEDAGFALPRLKDASLRAVFVHFPDPWWKKRHRKRLVVVPAFVAEVVRVLEPGGDLFVQTDVLERAEDYEAVLSASTTLCEAGDGAGPRLAENPYGARSPREHRALADGLPVFRLRYRRQ